jgi:hypothetical protein
MTKEVESYLISLRRRMRKCNILKKKQMKEKKIIMNIIETQTPYTVIAMTCNYKEKNDMRSKVTYRLIDSYHSLFLGKKDTISSEL